MRIATITRTAETCGRERKGDLPQLPRSSAEGAHPHARARELVRAVNAAKLERLFAKPFVAALPGAHADGAYCLAASPVSLRHFASGAADGELVVWDAGARAAAMRVPSAHRFVRAVCLTATSRLLSAGDDGVVKLWDYAREMDGSGHAPLAIYGSGEGALAGVDAHADGRLFVSAGTCGVALWDAERPDAPALRLAWGANAAGAVRFSRAERSLFAVCDAGRAVVLHDTRARGAVARVVMRMRCGAVSFNPQDPPLFAAACDDACAYLFDVRKLSRPALAYSGHAAAVTDVDWCPTGAGLATAGYDRTLRLWDARVPRARDVYHTKRMQRATAVRFSSDGGRLLSASDDGSIRIWKARASAPDGPIAPRHADALAYAAALVSRHAAVPAVARIANRRRLLAAVRASAVRDAQRRDADERRALKRARARPVFVPPVRPDPRDGVVVSHST